MPDDPLSRAEQERQIRQTILDLEEKKKLLAASGAAAERRGDEYFGRGWTGWLSVAEECTNCLDPS